MKDPPLKEVIDEEVIKSVEEDSVTIGQTISLKELLQDFIRYVSDKKGHKIGVGDYLIEKYIYEVFYSMGFYVEN